MRRTVLSGILAAALSLVACSDQPTEVAPSSPYQLPQASAVIGCPETPPTAGDILTLVSELLPRGPLRTSVILFVNALPPRFQERIKIAVRRRIFPIVDLIIRSFYAGRLNGGTSDLTFARTLALIKALHCYVGITPPDLPTTTTGADVVVGVALPNVPFTFCTPTTRGSISGSRDAVTPAMGGVTIVIRNLPDAPPPLRTSLDQYPYFYHYSGVTAAGPVEFNVPVTAALALKAGSFEGENPGVLRLAHNVGPAFGQVEVLPLPGPGELPVCSPVGSIRGGESGLFAWAKKLFSPAELQATSAAQFEIVRVGGKTRNFSDFGIVNPGSNPASINFNPDAATFSDLSAPPGTAVTPAPSVVVKSQKGTPIANVPVDFAVGAGGGTVNGGATATVNTNANGIATVTSWTLGNEPGTNTLTATPRAVAQVGSPGTPPYKPAAAFSPLFLTFTATATAPVVLSIAEGSNNQAGFANQILTDPLVVQATRNGSAAPNVPITFQVSTGGGSIAPTTVATNPDGFAETNWTLGSTTGTQTATASTPGATPVTFTATAAAAPPARIVLQWGTTPSDLDAHLTGPDPAPAVTRFHVYYDSPGSLTAAPFAALDRDDTDGLGPETITISQVQAGGLYRFSVHDYTNAVVLPVNPSHGLSNSGAKVTVYLASGASQVFNVPSSDEGGTLWTVFTLTDGAITGVNTLTYESNPGNVGAFSILGRIADATQSDAAVIRDATARHPK